MKENKDRPSIRWAGTFGSECTEFRVAEIYVLRGTNWKRVRSARNSWDVA